MLCSNCLTDEHCVLLPNKTKVYQNRSHISSWTNHTQTRKQTFIVLWLAVIVHSTALCSCL